ncbi:LpxD N-terminal domain-containing protein, partial [Idiomarina sp. UBA3162]|uniref:LpxD N-terminal domain-containing protein n=1 Tax=Idiomarina sp. UBA3162 TaxID=1946641 RepID=UPI0025C32B91
MTEYSLKQLAEYVDGEVRGDANLVVTGVGTLQSASAAQIAFLANSRYKGQLETSRAGAVILSPKDAEDMPAINAIVVNNPYAAFAKVAQRLDTTPLPAEGVAETAKVHASAKLGSNVALGEYVVIEAGAVIGDNVTIGAHTHIGPEVTEGADTKIWSGV